MPLTTKQLAKRLGVKPTTITVHLIRYPVLRDFIVGKSGNAYLWDERVIEIYANVVKRGRSGKNARRIIQSHKKSNLLGLTTKGVAEEVGLPYNTVKSMLYTNYSHYKIGNDGRAALWDPAVVDLLKDYYAKKRTRRSRKDDNASPKVIKTEIEKLLILMENGIQVIKTGIERLFKNR